MIYITPLYILLLLANAQQTINRLAGFFGIALSPFIYIFVGDWAILIAGFIGGTATMFVQWVLKVLQPGKQEGK